MNKIITITLSAFLSFNSFASALDVKPDHILRKGEAYVRVTKSANDRVKFEKCISGSELKSCENLGNKSSYSIKELRSQRSEENREIAYAIGADIGIAVTAFLAGTTASIYVIAMGSQTVATVAPALTLTGVKIALNTIAVAEIGGGLMLSKIDAINPLEQTRQAKTLNEDIINDKDVRIENAEMDAFIKRLDLVLSDIEGTDKVYDQSRNITKAIPEKRESSGLSGSLAKLK